MADFSIRSDSVDVEQIMRQIRARIREKRGADYTEQEIQRLATAKLETFLDPSRVRSDLLDQFRRARAAAPEAPSPNYAFEDSTLFETHRGAIRFMRKLLLPILKLFFNPQPLADALHIQADLNRRTAERFARREQVEELYYELIHNLVLEVTRLSIEVKNMKMTVDSVAGRLDFDERRARALEGAVQYRPAALAPKPPAGEPDRSAQRPADRSPAPQAGDQGERRRRRRRRGRRHHGEQPGHGAPAEHAAEHNALQQGTEISAGAEQSERFTEPESSHPPSEPSATEARSAESGHADTGTESFDSDDQP
jgi:hypothetical protein